MRRVCLSHCLQDPQYLVIPVVVLGCDLHYPSGSRLPAAASVFPAPRCVWISFHPHAGAVSRDIHPLFLRGELQTSWQLGSFRGIRRRHHESVNRIDGIREVLSHGPATSTSRSLRRVKNGLGLPLSLDPISPSVADYLGKLLEPPINQYSSKSHRNTLGRSAASTSFYRMQSSVSSQTSFATPGRPAQPHHHSPIPPFPVKFFFDCSSKPMFFLRQF